jgi:hypothetical protein
MAYLMPIEEDAPGDLHLIKNEVGQVIGFECQFYHLPLGSIVVGFITAPLTVAYELIAKTTSNPNA